MGTTWKAIAARPKAVRRANDNSVTTSSKARTIKQTRTPVEKVHSHRNPFDALEPSKAAKKAKKSPVAAPAAAKASVAVGEVGSSGTLTIGDKKGHFKVLSKDDTKRVIQLTSSTGRDLKPKKRLKDILDGLKDVLPSTTRGKVTVPISDLVLGYVTAAVSARRRRLASAEAVLGPLLGESKSLQ